MQNLKLREEERLADAEQAITSANSTEAKGLAEEARGAGNGRSGGTCRATTRPATQAELQPKRNAVIAARADAAAAEAAPRRRRPKQRGTPSAP